MAKRRHHTSDGTTALERGIRLHDLAVQGRTDLTDKAYELLQACVAKEPANALAKAYCGSCLALQGRDATHPNQRLAKALAGVEMIDQAVSADPDNTEIRALRAHVNYNLPEMFFGRTSVAIADFRYLLDRYDKDPTTFSLGQCWDTLYHLGRAYKNIGEDEEAEAVWRQLLSLRPHRRYWRLLRREGMNVGEVGETGRSEKRYQALLGEGIKWHNQAAAGGPAGTGRPEHAAAAQTAHDVFGRALDLYPGDALLEAYRASSLSLLGRYAKESGDMFAHAIKAIEMIDKAVQKAPDDIQVRLIRANHSHRLPEAFFHRTAVAIADFTYVAAEYERGRRGLAASDYHEVLCKLGGAYRRLGMTDKARTTWQRLLAAAPGSVYRAEIEQELAAIDTAPPVAEAMPEAYEELWAEGARLHALAVLGHQWAAAGARRYLEQAYHLRPGDPVTKAYYGSCTALEARYSNDPSVMFGGAIQGLMLIANALRQAPDNLRIRLLRGYLCFNLPEALFHLAGTAVEDFEFIKGAYGADLPEDTRGISADEYGQVLQDLSLAYERLGPGASRE